MLGLPDQPRYNWTTRSSDHKHGVTSHTALSVTLTRTCARKPASPQPRSPRRTQKTASATLDDCSPGGLDDGGETDDSSPAGAAGRGITGTTGLRRELVPPGPGAAARPATADMFLNAYQEEAGETVREVTLWDLFALTNSHRTVDTWVPDYHDLGRTNLSAADLRQRHTDWTTARLANWSAGTG